MVGFCDLVGVVIAPVSKKPAVKRLLPNGALEKERIMSHGQTFSEHNSKAVSTTKDAFINYIETKLNFSIQFFDYYFDLKMLCLSQNNFRK